MLENKRKNIEHAILTFLKISTPTNHLSRLQFLITRQAELPLSSDQNESLRPHGHLMHLPHNHALSKVSPFHELDQS